MAELKTKKNDGDVTAFLNKIENDQRRKDCFEVLRLMQDITGSPPKMWGPSIVGFGDYHYTYASGRNADWFYVGFSPRKQNLTLYIMNGFTHYEALLKQLGKCSTGKSCLYIKKLDDIDRSVLRKLVEESVTFLKSRSDQ